MSRVLVVDDSLTAAVQVRLMLEAAGFEVEHALNGLLALEAMSRRVPDVVLTDMQMPEMNGLELVEAVRGQYPGVPVVLMTAHGSEELAVLALQQGAASYVPKPDLGRDIILTLSHVLGVAGASRQQQRLLDCLTQIDSQFLLENDPSLIAPLNGYVQDTLTRMKIGDETELIRIGMAVHEAVQNAIYHGNLELGAAAGPAATRLAHDELADRRRGEAPYRDRKVSVIARVSRDKAVYIVRDEGSGFDRSLLPDPTDPANFERAGGRGLLLIRTFMDEVHHNDAGNEITMIKYRED
ncbi:MAG: response regulator [Planctomycetota bacterium]